MNKELKNKYPQWITKINNKKYTMCLSDDLDSLFSCIILNDILDLKVTRFYDFNNIYINDKDTKKCIGVDMDLIKGKCWGNHVTLNNNSQSANINSIMGINGNNYTQKFCGSTLLQILSYYNVNIDNFTNLQKAILLSIDSTFLGYYFNDGYYCKKYLKLLEMDSLLKVVGEHPKSDFIKLDNKYNLNKGKIWFNDGKLETNLNLKKLEEIFPQYKFTEFLDNIHNLELKANFNTYKGYLNADENELFSCAMTYRNKYCYSIRN